VCVIFMLSPCVSSGLLLPILWRCHQLKYCCYHFVCCRSVAPQGGVEYVIELEQPPNLFVVRKQLRRGQDITAPGALTALSFYYILDS
jgi:hypothetical protein